MSAAQTDCFRLNEDVGAVVHEQLDEHAVLLREVQVRLLDPGRVVEGRFAFVVHLCNLQVENYYE